MQLQAGKFSEKRKKRGKRMRKNELTSNTSPSKMKHIGFTVLSMRMGTCP